MWGSLAIYGVAKAPQCIVGFAVCVLQDIAAGDIADMNPGAMHLFE